MSFLEMGGYGQFVWPAYGITALLMAGLLAHALWQRRTQRRKLNRLLAAQNASGNTSGGKASDDETTRAR